MNIDFHNGWSIDRILRVGMRVCYTVEEAMTGKCHQASERAGRKPSKISRREKVQ